MNGPFTSRDNSPPKKIGRLSEIINQYSSCPRVSLKFQQEDPKISVSQFPFGPHTNHKSSTIIKRKAGIFKNRVSIQTGHQRNLDQSIVQQRHVILSNGQNLTKQFLMQKPNHDKINIKQLFKKKDKIFIQQKKQNIQNFHQMNIKGLSKPVQTKVQKNNDVNKLQIINSAIHKCQKILSMGKKQNTCGKDRQPMMQKINNRCLSNVRIPALNQDDHRVTDSFSQEMQKNNSQFSYDLNGPLTAIEQGYNFSQGFTLSFSNGNDQKQDYHSRIGELDNQQFQWRNII